MVGPDDEREANAGPGYPGVWPFTRGSRAVPADPPWIPWQGIAEPELAVAVEQVHDDREGGVRGVWLRLDRAARMGVDPGDEAAAERCGVDGIAATDVADLGLLVEAAGPGDLALRLDAGGNALPAAALLLAGLAAAGRDDGSVALHLGLDPLGALATDGVLPAPPEILAGEAAALVAGLASRRPAARALTASGAPYARGGADAVQQLALVIATAIEYARWLEARGIGPEVAFAQIDLLIEGDRDLLLDLCKVRALRTLWGKVVAACGVEPVAPFVHCATGWRTLTRREPWNNALRATVQCAAAILGGADAITTTPFDAPLGRPSALGRRVARNTQLILAQECGLGRPVDAAGGAYAVEQLTHDLAVRAWALLQELEASGGLLACLRDGHVHALLAESTRRRAERIGGGSAPVLGVTAHAAPSTPAPELRLPDCAAARGEAAAGTTATWAELLEAAAAGATIGELSRAHRAGAEAFTMAAIPCAADESLGEPPAGAGASS